MCSTLAKATSTFREDLFRLPYLRRSWLHENIAYHRSANSSKTDKALVEQLAAIRIKDLGIQERPTRACEEEDARSHV